MATSLNYALPVLGYQNVTLSAATSSPITLSLHVMRYDYQVWMLALRLSLLVTTLCSMFS